MSYYDPLHLVSKALELTQSSVKNNPWSTRTPDPTRVETILRSTPDACANITTAVDLKTCIDTYCANQSHHGIVNPDLKLDRFHTSLQGALKSPAIAGLSQKAIVGKVLDSYKGFLCKDQPPPPGATVPIPASVPVQVDLPDEAPVRSENCGYAASIPPETKPGWWLVLGGFLGILAFRAAQTATGAFFLFFEPENHTSRPNIT